MPKKIVKEYAVQFEEIQDRNEVIEKFASRLVELARKQAKQLKDLPTPEPPKPA